MTEVSYLEGLLKGKGRKVRELIGVKFTAEQVKIVEESTINSFEEVLDLSETQFDALVTRLGIN